MPRRPIFRRNGVFITNPYQHNGNNNENIKSKIKHKIHNKSLYGHNNHINPKHNHFNNQKPNQNYQKPYKNLKSGFGPDRTYSDRLRSQGIINSSLNNNQNAQSSQFQSPNSRFNSRDSVSNSSNNTSNNANTIQSNSSHVGINNISHIGLNNAPNNTQSDIYNTPRYNTPKTDLPSSPHTNTNNKIESHRHTSSNRKKSNPQQNSQHNTQQTHNPLPRYSTGTNTAYNGKNTASETSAASASAITPQYSQSSLKYRISKSLDSIANDGFVGSKWVAHSLSKLINPTVSIAYVMYHLTRYAFSGAGHRIRYLFDSILSALGLGKPPKSPQYYKNHPVSPRNRHIIIALLICLSLIGGSAVAYVVMSPKDQDQICMVGHKHPSDTFEDIKGSTGPWTKKGSKAYNTAKAVYKFFKSEGCNDAQAAGAVGNITQEDSTFDLKEAEHDDSNLNGEGLFQFTRGTKTSYLNYCHREHLTPWTIKSECLGIFGAYGRTVKEYINQKTTSPEMAAFHFYKDVEDPTASFSAGQGGNRAAGAKTIYKMFNGIGGSSKDDDIATANDTDASRTETTNCDFQKNGTTDSGIPDGTGHIRESFTPSGVMTWPWKGAPSDVKQYVKQADPNKYNMHWGYGSGWADDNSVSNGQCVQFPNSMAPAIWKSDGVHAVMGNGGQIAQNMAHSKGGSLTSIPHAGAIASTGYGPLTGGGWSPGHTFMVIHVLSNGDMLCLEENMVDIGHNGSGCGSDVHKPKTWDILGVSHTKIKPQNFKFYMPKGKPDWH